LPDSLTRALDQQGKHLTITGVRFAYGQAQILQALASAQRINHLAVAQLDRFGNLTRHARVPLVTYGKTAEQAKALIGDAANRIAAQAHELGMPVVIERLDFQRRKAALETTDARQARLLSSFAYQRTLGGIRAACLRAGVQVIEVNPAYTSVIGAIQHAQGRGISIHMGAAATLARRGLGLSEKPTQREALVPTRNGGHVTFELPVRNRSKHVWSFWSASRTRLKAALAAHLRSGAHTQAPAPLPRRETVQALGAYRSSGARSPGANRQQHCSADVTGFSDVPY